MRTGWWHWALSGAWCSPGAELPPAASDGGESTGELTLTAYGELVLVLRGRFQRPWASSRCDWTQVSDGGTTA